MDDELAGIDHVDDVDRVEPFVVGARVAVRVTQSRGSRSSRMRRDVVERRLQAAALFSTPTFSHIIAAQASFTWPARRRRDA